MSSSRGVEIQQQQSGIIADEEEESVGEVGRLSWDWDFSNMTTSTEAMTMICMKLEEKICMGVMVEEF